MAQRWRNYIVGTLFTVVAGWIVLVLPGRLGLEALSFDLPFLIRPDMPLTEAVIVYMDEESRGRLQQSPQEP